MADRPLLTVDKLTVSYPDPTGGRRAVLKDVSFTLGRERLGIVGESGSGKSTCGRAIMRILPPQAKVGAARLDFDGIDLLAAGERTMRSLRGRRIAMVLQDPRYALNPLHTVGRQIGEALRLHTPMGKAEVRDRVLALIEDVRIRDPRRVASLYPHELSGGMGQRVMIAMMLAADPDLVIADEPTSALDVTVRGQILDLLHDTLSARGAGLIFITHDLPMVSDFCDRVLILYAGEVMETVAARDLAAARHPYTKALLGCLPPLDHKVDRLMVVERDPAWTSGRTP